jgi:hypothetical protein
MAQVHVERLDHLGVSAAVIKAIGFIDLLNARLGPDQPEVLTPGAAVAGMMLHGLGCAKRPLSLPPQLLASTPRDLWLHDGIRAEMFNRFTLGRTLDEASAEGGARRCHELALGVCARDGSDLRGNPRDTTSFARRGAYIPERDAQAMTSTPG